jgi:hypothetical protein
LVWRPPGSRLSRPPRRRAWACSRADDGVGRIMLLIYLSYTLRIAWAVTESEDQPREHVRKGR